jgi:hemerythrin
MEPEKQGEMMDDMLTFLLKWLYQHIIGQDSMIGKIKPEEKMEYKGGFPDEFKTGIMMIDAEHKELFRIFDEMKELLEDEYVRDKYDQTVHLLEELKDYAEKHFHDEEKYMESIQYKGLEAQKKAHRSYIDYIDDLDLENIDDNQQEGLRNILDFLAGWLVNHILKMDKKIG